MGTRAPVLSSRESEPRNPEAQTRTARSASDSTGRRRYPIGAEVIPGGGVDFRVWAPSSKRAFLQLALQGSDGDSDFTEIEMLREERGYFSLREPQARAGMLYKFKLESGSFPDPASRFQPNGPHEASQIVDPARFRWTDAQWRGVERGRELIYELHIGTLTTEGNWAGAMERLPYLAGLGVTLLEVMPVAEFPGRFGWGYDGVDLFAPTRLYGSPDDFRAFVNRAHELGLGVILDVVYNHLGPDGNYLKAFSPHYFTDRHKNEWGQAINFDDEDSSPVREFFITNAAYWIEEYHLDGLRLDATQQIFDFSGDHILKAISGAVRKAAPGRRTFLVAENECQHAILALPADQGGYGLDAIWSEDFHHAAVVAATGRNEAYYSDFKGSPQELISAVKRGFLFQGQWFAWQSQNRGLPAARLHPNQFVTFLENHDQIANSIQGKRLTSLASPGRIRALTALLLLGPGTPLLFQGQEFGAQIPFLYFADHDPGLARLVAKGRKEFLSQFASISSPGCESILAAPEDERTFLACKLDWTERDKNKQLYRLHRDLIQMRERDPVFRNPLPNAIDGAVLGPEAFALRFFSADSGNDRLLLVNLGLDLSFRSIPEPLIAPPAGREWKVQWTSEEPTYGGRGAGWVHSPATGAWHIPGQAAVLLHPGSLPQARDGKANPPN